MHMYTALPRHYGALLYHTTVPRIGAASHDVHKTEALRAMSCATKENSGARSVSNIKYIHAASFQKKKETWPTTHHIAEEARHSSHSR